MTMAIMSAIICVLIVHTLDLRHRLKLMNKWCLMQDELICKYRHKRVGGQE